MFRRGPGGLPGPPRSLLGPDVSGPSPQPEPQTPWLNYSGQALAAANAQSGGTVFEPFPGALASRPQLIPAFITVALQSPEQPQPVFFDQDPSRLSLSPRLVPAFITTALQSPEQPPAVFRSVDQPALTPPPLRAAIQNTLQSPEQPAAVFTPADIAALAKPIIGQFVATPQADPSQPAALSFRQPPASIAPLTFQPGPVIQNTLQSPEQAPSRVQGQMPPTALPPVITQLYGSPQLSDLTLQGQIIRVDIAAIPPSIRVISQGSGFDWSGHSSAAAAAQNTPSTITVVPIAEALQPPALRNTLFSGPQVIDLTVPASVTRTFFVPPPQSPPNRPATFMVGPQLVDFSLYPSRIFGAPPSSSGVVTTQPHVYPPGLSLMGMGRTFV